MVPLSVLGKLRKELVDRLTEFVHRPLERRIATELQLPKLRAELASLHAPSGGTGSASDARAATGQAEWEELPMQTPLQGLPLVAHGGKIYRVGGLTARNATTEEKEDLHSTNEFAEFDPATGKWTALAPLPAP